jgi:hypothetical protein
MITVINIRVPQNAMNFPTSLAHNLPRVINHTMVIIIILLLFNLSLCVTLGEASCISYCYKSLEVY